MGSYVARDPKGTPFIFKIAGSEPTPMEAARIDAIFKNGPPKPVAATPPPEDTEPGIGANFAANVAKGWNEAQAGVDFGMQGLHEYLGNKEKADEWGKAAAAQLAERDEYKVREKGFLEEEGVYGKAASLAGTIGRTGAAMAGGAAATIGGAAIGGVPGAVGGFLLGTGAYAPQMLSANAERQIEQHGRIKDWDKAFAATGLQAGVESIMDRITLGIAGVGYRAAKAPLKAALGVSDEVVERSVNKALTTAAGRIGTTAAFGAVSGAAEEVVQQGLERWQAEMPLMDDASKEEYLESAIVGGILEGVFGAGAGYVGHRQSVKAQTAEQDAIEDVAAEAATKARAVTENYTEHQRQRDAKYEDPPLPPETEKEQAKVAGALADYSAETREQKAIQKDIVQLPPGLRLDEEAPQDGQTRREKYKADLQAREAAGVGPNDPIPPMQGPVKPVYSEPEYRDAIDKLRPYKSISVDRIVKDLKMPRDKAKAVFDEMLRRNDAYPAGSQNQYARITVPHGIATREGSNARGEFDPRVSRDFIVKPVQPANQLPFAVELNGKKIGGKKKVAFATRKEAEDWIAKTVPESKRKNATVAEDTSGQQFGIYQQTYRHSKDNDESLIGEQVVDTYATREEADEAVKGYDPGYSPQTNRQRKRMPVEVKEAAAADDLLRELGGMESKLQTAVNSKVGTGRAQVDLVPAITRNVLKKLFPNMPDADMPGEDTVIEGMVPPSRDPRDVVKNVITLGADLNSPTLTEDERLKLIEDVLNHELIHLIRNLDLLTAKEWNQLYKAALSQKVPGKTYTWAQRAAAMHRGANTNLIMEEAIAEMFRAYVRDPTSFRNPERGILKKLADFIKKLIGLGKRHDAEDLMDMISQGGIADRELGAGGLGARPGNQDDAFYSLIKPDNFYLKSRQAIERNKQKIAPALQWKATLKNAGIKDEEMNWLKLDEWLDDIAKDGPVERQDILNYIDANAVFIHPNIQASPTDPILGAKTLASPEWKDMQTRGGQDYSEVVFSFTMPSDRIGEPTYETDHFYYQNYLAHARLKTVIEKGTGPDGRDKKILFIEEIQSDLHQDAGKYGGYYSASLLGLDEQLKREVREQEFIKSNISNKYNDLNNKITTEWSKANRIALAIRNETSLPRKFALTKEHESIVAGIRSMQQEREVVEEKYNDQAERVKAKRREATSVEKRLRIPNAPFKTNWEDYVIKRLIRHAVEHDFDAVAWHGQPESLAETEKYTLAEGVHPKTGTKTYHAYEGGPNITSIVQRYTQKLPRIVNKLVQRFGLNVDSRPATENFKEAPRVRQRSFTDDDLYVSPLTDTMGVNRALPSRANFKSALNRIKARQQRELAMAHHTQQAEDEQNDLIARLEQANQIVLNQRVFNAYAALSSAGLITTLPGGVTDANKLRDILVWKEGNNNWSTVLGDRQSRADEIEKPKPNNTGSGGFPWQHYQVDFSNDALREAFARGDIPMFSRIGPPLYAAAAPMGQRVPASPPIATLQTIHDKVLYNNLAPVLQRFFGYIPGTGAKTHDVIEDTIIHLQDRMLPIGKLIDRMKKNGGFITNENDTYLRETLFSGQTDAQLVNAERDYYKPFKDAIKATGTTKADVDDAIRTFGVGSNVQKILQRYSDPRHALTELYVYAQHAQERNAEMRKRNDPLQNIRPLAYEAGSGLTDNEARQILDWFARKPFGRKFSDETDPNSVRSRVRAIIKYTNDVRVAGNLSPDFRTMTKADGSPADPYTDYVPIRGIMKDGLVEDDELRNFARTGQGFNIRGKEDFSAIGRETSLGHDILANLIIQNQEAIVRANKNKIGQSFRQLILDNPTEMADVAEIIPTPKTEYVFDRKSGTVKQKNVDYKLLNDKSVLKIKIDKGQQVFIKIHDPKIAKAMNPTRGLGNTGMDNMITGLLAINRLMAALRTSYNPEFVISNFFRDFESAMLNLSEAEQKGLRRKVAKSVIPAIKGIRKVVRREDLTSDWAKAYEEFRLMGGQTAFYGIHELEDTMKHINKEFREDASGGPNKVKKQLATLQKFVSDYNLMIENGSRLAAYKTLRDEYLARSGNPNDPATQKMAKEMAARAAKNLTVNFNMGGEGKTFINAFYLFFNASLQGAMALINPLIRSKKMRMVWGGVLMAGIVQDILMSMLSEEDDDGENIYDKIPDHVLQHNIVFMDPFGITDRGYMNIPMPYLMNGIYNFGRVVSKAVRGEGSMGEVASSGIGTLLESLNPFGSSNSVLNFVAPSIIDPIVDLAQNEDFTGKPIAPAVSPYSDVQENRSQQYWNNTNPAYVTIADWMSQLTGRKGDYLPGLIEVSPNHVDYAVKFLTGGVGPFVARAAWIAGGAAKGDMEDISAYDIPFLRKVYGEVSERNDMEAFIGGRDQVLRIKKALQSAAKDGNRDLYMKIMRDYPQEYRLSARINALENARKKLSTRIKKIRDSELPDEKKKELIKQARDRQNILVGTGNQLLEAAGIE